MDNKFYTDNFERLLREKSDEFKMYPSKRVWHSVYNNLHPGRKWPSVTMCITLIAALSLVGYLNTDTSRHNSYNITPQIPANNQSFYTPFLIAIEDSHTEFLQKNVLNPYSKQLNNSSNSSAPVSIENTTTNNNTKLKIGKAIKQAGVSKDNSGKSSFAVVKTIRKFNTHITQADAIAITNNATNKSIIETESNGIVENTFLSNSIKSNSTPVNNTLAKNDVKNKSSLTEEIDPVNNTIEVLNTEKSNKLLKDEQQLGKNETLKEITANQHGVINDHKDWIDNYALYNRPEPKKWAGKLAWQAYITPSVVYRKLYSIGTGKVILNNNNSSLVVTPDANNSVVSKPSGGIEIGGGFKYALSKRIKATGGIQFNFTRYNIQALENSHPVSTSLQLIDPQTNLPHEVYRSTIYSNIYGLYSITLHNETYQLSIPLGLEFKVGGIGNLEWYAGATVQPTVLLHAKNYLISSDRISYVKDGAYLNRFNLNAGFETFVSYKTSNGLTWQFGPQFRTQLFTTNSRIYSVGEKLMNFGFKFGITKNL